MKKIISVLLVLAMVLMAGCGGAGSTEAPTEPVETTPAYTPNPAQATVNNPMTEIPNYSLPEGASVAEMRAMAVQAMHDSLTVKWTPIQNFSYKKAGSGDSYNYQFSASSVYGGILYAEGGAGLMQWMEGMDLSNGVLYDVNFANIGKLQGSSCSAACCWGLAAVCPNLTGIYSTHYMLIKNGFIPLGDVTYDENLDSFKNYTTGRICADNGEQTVAEGYALAQPGDVVISSGDDTTDVHAMMVITVPEVVRKADGTIDMEASVLHIQDQRFKDTEEKVDDQIVYYRGRTDAEYTFAELFKRVYIAMSPEDFLKEGAYTPAFSKRNSRRKATRDRRNRGTRSGWRTSWTDCSRRWTSRPVRRTKRQRSREDRRRML